MISRVDSFKFGAARFTVVLTVLILSAPQVSAQGTPQSSTACTIDPRDSVIGPESTIRPGNGPVFLAGPRATAVVLVHGFMASPFEVRALGEKLNKEGYPVLMPLLAGFGRSDAEANYARIADWRQSVDAAVADVGRCHQKVILMGFSLGGALVTDFILRKADAEGQIRGGPKVVGLTLISPYFKPAVFMAETINQVALFFKTDSLLSVRKLYKVAPVDDLKAPVAFPAHYNRAMPLVGVDNVIRLGHEIETQGTQQPPSSIPTLLVVSEADGTIDVEAAQEFVLNEFTSRQQILISKEKKIPHQILVREFSLRSIDAVLYGISKFAAGLED